MPDVGVNSISVLGRELLLVDVGGGAETHLAATDDQATARAALAEGRTHSASSAVAAGYDEGALLARRWAPSTLCGRAWWEMAAGDVGTFRRWQEVALAPTCRSCLRVIDAWFPAAESPGGVELLASVVADTVEAFGSAHIIGVPAQHLESVRRSARKHLRQRGFRSQTYVVSAVVHVTSDDAYQAIDPALSEGWIAEALARIDAGDPTLADRPVVTGHDVDWHTWVIDG
ncbi:hypothetical protein PO878_04270 [Iamia majanohamensis]|uniref:Uncharacterized protein n=1 Tax=Iamia majanohamensis TaxID=467976 RepID=A0AAE9YB88_9ACTN|nr:hypothetical protein [Iamia majanohamensis]WCO67938.1 hypothetical protein PO878_04270 [Iamia majanohamensis]